MDDQPDGLLGEIGSPKNVNWKGINFAKFRKSICKVKEKNQLSTSIIQRSKTFKSKEEEDEESFIFSQAYKGD